VGIGFFAVLTNGGVIGMFELEHEIRIYHGDTEARGTSILGFRTDIQDSKRSSSFSLCLRASVVDVFISPSRISHSNICLRCRREW
jgi:hypothetical protein